MEKSCCFLEFKGREGANPVVKYPISQCQFCYLPLFFYLLQKLSNINKANRAKQKIRHTLGKKSFARITAEKVFSCLP